MNDIDYRGFGVNVFECELEDEKRKQKFTFITDIKITKSNAKKLMNAGRSRWRIENEGFNRQKNLRYHIEHASSQDYNAMK
ncbi:transposase, partial [Caldibacillus thermoamylovorans]|nr:transposase [Caldibacillus thermoamylovorans]